MDTVTVAPPGLPAREDYWLRVQALRAELGRLRPPEPAAGRRRRRVPGDRP